jgi:putative ABC transport system ATP-binding protein
VLTQTIIKLTDLTFYYQNQQNKPVINIAEWSVEKGESIFLHGPSGAGKSTLLNLLGGVLVPQQGEVEILGQNLSQLSAKQRDQFRAKHLGYVFQQFNLIPYLSAIDNIKLAAFFAKFNNQHSVEQMLDRLHIDSSLFHCPTSQLSLGQQQRVAIARALVNQPEVLIVDEPTSSLDAANSNAFIELLMQTVSETKTSLIFVSHDLSLAEHFSRIENINDINQVEG